MTFSTPTEKVQWLMDISGGDGLLALEIGIHRGFVGDGTLELIIKKTKLSDDSIQNLLLEQFSSNANAMLPIINEPCIQRLWTIEFQFQHLCQVCRHLNKEPFDVVLRSSIYSFEILDELFYHGYSIVSDSTIKYQVATNNFKYLQWFLKRFMRRGYDYVSFQLVKIAIKYSEFRIINILLDHMNDADIEILYDEICRQLAMERGYLEIMEDLFEISVSNCITAQKC